MVILEYQLLEFTNLKEYWAKIRGKLKNPNILELRMTTIS